MVELLTEIKNLQNKVEKLNKKQPIAIQLVQYKKSPNGPIPTGLKSPIVGGYYTLRTKKYKPIENQKDIVEIQCYSSQFDFVLNNNMISSLVADTLYDRTTSAAIRLLKLMIERPGNIGLIIGPSYKECLPIFNYIKKIIPYSWIKKNPWSVEKYLELLNDSKLIARTAKCNNSVRAISANYGCVIEAQDIKSNTIDSFLPCIRDSKNTIFFEIGSSSHSNDFSKRCKKRKQGIELEKEWETKTFILDSFSFPEDKGYLYII